MPLKVFLHTLSALAYKEIKKNGEFVLPGFGKLVKQKRKARTGFNPRIPFRREVCAFQLFNYCSEVGSVHHRWPAVTARRRDLQICTRIYSFTANTAASLLRKGT